MTQAQVIMFRIEQVAGALRVHANGYLEVALEARSTGRHDHVARQRCEYVLDRAKPYVSELDSLFADLRASQS